MTSLNPQANALLDAYNAAMSLDLPMNAAYERWLCEAHGIGLTAEDFALAIRSRLKFNANSGCKKGLLLHHFCMGVDNIAVTLNEAAVVRSQQRIKVVDAGKAEVLRATHRPATAPEGEAVRAGNLKLIQDLRDAAAK